MMLSFSLDTLNTQQKEAVTSQGRPLLVLAGAGSGKTRVITYRIAYCIEAFGVDPRSIMAVTFTNKAADEMRQRVAEMVDPERASRVMIKTFHAFGAWLLRRYGEAVGLSPQFTIYDDDDSLTLLHTIYPRWKRNELKPYVKAISRAKDRGITPADDLSEISRDHRFQEMYTAYQRRLEEIGSVDFGDLIFRAVQLLRKDRQLRERLKNRFSHILVDEYQDSNGTQFKLLQELFRTADPQSGRPATELCVVGDDDQSIYRFRGAEVENILQFPEHFPGTEIIKLEENYRSTGNILFLASELVSNNRGRHPKTLWTSKGAGEKPVLAFVADHRSEAEFCADLVSRDHNYDGTAILYRTNAQSAPFETLFVQRGIPYKIVGALRFYDREEVKDALALISFVLNPADIVSFRRIINKPARGIGKTSQEKILRRAEMGQNTAEASESVPIAETSAEAESSANDELSTTAESSSKAESSSAEPSAKAAEPAGSCILAAETAIEAGEVKGKAKTGIAEFITWYRSAVDTLEVSDLSEWVQSVLESSGIVDYHKRQDEIAATQKVSNLEQFINEVSRYAPGRRGLTEFLETLQLDPSRVDGKDPADQPGVTLITMHNTKGLEFERVIISGLEEGLFPSSRSESDEEIEEERRIFYVSITRAQEELYLTSCRRRSLWGSTSMQMPSRFLGELPADHLKIIGGSRRDLHRPSVDPWGSGFENDFESGFDIPASRGPLERKPTRSSQLYDDASAAGFSRRADVSQQRLQKTRHATRRPNSTAQTSPKTPESPGFPGSSSAPGSRSSPDSFNALGSHNSRDSIDEAADAAAEGETSFSAGDRIYHDQYGPGWITAAWVENGRELVTVRFETGKTMKFLPAYSPLEKIAQD